MSFQIRSIVVYSKAGDVREIRLRVGSLNIITGASKTGKSSLLDIIDYCLGSTGFPVSAGVVRETTSAYGLLLQKGHEGVFVARLAPGAGRSVSSQFHLRTVSPDDPPPALADLTPNADLNTARAELSAFAEIRENTHEPESGTRLPLRATIRHSLFFCMQGQDEIASRNVLFHSQAGEFTPQAIRDVIPYFLGAVPDDHLAKVNRLRRLRREAKQLSRGVAERGALLGPTGREQALLLEAQKVGLIEDVSSDEDASPIDLLENAMRASEPELHLPDSHSFSDLSAERQELRQEFSRVKASLANLELVSRERGEYTLEAEEQRSRLSLSKMFRDTDPGLVCPICSSELTEGNGVESLMQDLQVLEGDLAAISTTTPELTSLISAAQAQLSDLEDRLRENQVALDEVERGSRLLQQYREASIQRALVRGRISLFLGAQVETIVDETLDERLADLEAEIASLAAELDTDEAAARLTSALSRVGANISAIASGLELEHAGSPTRLDPQALTVIADTLEGPIRLNEMGSAENHVGYHLATMLGMHRLFIESHRPVPRFLFLDQPSQVYFPSDVDEPDLTDDEDREALTRMLGAADSEVERHNGEFQVILVDHADLDLPWFQDAVVEKWRGGDALIPRAWTNGVGD